MKTRTWGGLSEGSWIGIVLVALALGLAQQWRGAHFMSHTLWSAVVCWLVAWLVQEALPRAVAHGRKLRA